jgi:hypothetical protein
VAVCLLRKVQGAAYAHFEPFRSRPVVTVSAKTKLDILLYAPKGGRNQRLRPKAAPHIIVQNVVAVDGHSARLAQHPDGRPWTPPARPPAGLADDRRLAPGLAPISRGSPLAWRIPLRVVFKVENRAGGGRNGPRLRG